MSKRAFVSPVSLALGALLLAPGLVHAAAGSVLFTLGRVEIQRNGQTLPAQRGSAVEVGDTVSTGPTGLTQLRMRDGSLMALKSGTVMTVEDFQLPATRVPAVASLAGSAAPAAVASQDTARSVFRLVRGAFRTVTGLIGKAAGDDYRVVTPAATIGIRGTDYTAAYCSGDCQGSADGLYVGVSVGGVTISNDQGQLPLGDNEYAYVKDTGTPPRQQTDPPRALEAPLDGDAASPESDDESGDAANAPPSADSAGTGTALGTGEATPEGTYELQPGQPGAFAFSLGPFQGASRFAAVSNSDIYLDANSELVGFLARDTKGPALYDIGTASNMDPGSDPATGMRWGRWQGGVAAVSDGSLDLTTKSLHWIYGLNPTPVLPTSGSVSYSKASGTAPTDALGNTGNLVSATLTADFTKSTVASTLLVNIGVESWNASGNGSLISGAPAFTGTYGVTVTGGAGGTVSGTGGFAGFFVEGGAGLSYSLVSGTNTVNGAVALVSPNSAP